MNIANEAKRQHSTAIRATPSAPCRAGRRAIWERAVRKPSPALRKNDPPTHKWPHQRHRSPVRSARPRGLRAGDIARGPVLQRLPVLQGISMVGPPGFEPATSSLSGRSTRLPDQDLSADSACYQGLLLPATCMMLQRFPAPRGLFVDSEQHRTAHSPTERDRAPMRSHLARGGRS